jgi:hypothetical protein
MTSIGLIAQTEVAKKIMDAAMIQHPVALAAVLLMSKTSSSASRYPAPYNNLGFRYRINPTPHFANSIINQRGNNGGLQIHFVHLDEM